MKVIETQTLNSFDKKPAGNMGFSAMLAEEYILIVPFACYLKSGLDEWSRARECNINYINFTQLRFGLTNYGPDSCRESTQQKALDVV